MLMAGLGGCGGPRSPTAAGRGRDGRGMEAGSLRGVVTAVGPHAPRGRLQAQLSSSQPGL